LAVSSRAGQLRAEGKAVLNFAAGEPDFVPPKAVREAVAASSLRDPVRYTAVPGTTALREAVARSLSEVHGREFAVDEILVSCGAKHSLANLFLATCDVGDEVIIPAPYWVSYPDMVGLAEATPVIAPSHRADGWRLQPDALAEVITPHTKMLILNSPSNPTGAGYRAQDIAALGRVLAERAPDAWIVCDDIYRQLTYGDFEFASAVRALRGITDNVIVVDGVSKTYAMTGYRIGFLAAPRDIVKAASNIQSQMTSGAATPSQHAALVALTDPSVAADVADMHEAFTRRRSLIVDGLSAIPGVEVSPPDGAFYVFTDVSAHVGEGTEHADDVAFATWLLEQKLVATVPGTPFGAPGYLRMSYATDDASLREGVSRIAEAIASLPTGR
jgi:aspartate aminotransferase